MSVAQSLGTFTPASIAARMTEVPSGTVTGTPSMESVTCFTEMRAGVPPSSSLTEYIRFPPVASSSLGRLACSFDTEIFREMIERAQHRERRHAAHRAQRSIDHGFAQIPQQGDVALALFAAHDALDHLHAARGADAAGRALPAGFDRAELHRITRHARHVHRIVECNDAAMTDHRAQLGERLVVELRIELRLGQERAERTADLHRTDRT